MSTAMREVLPIMQLLSEFVKNDMLTNFDGAAIHCKIFEDNAGAIEIAKVPKMRPRTKHINQNYHFFRQYVDDGTVSVNKIDTEDQPADMLTKPLSLNLFKKHRLTIMGW